MSFEWKQINEALGNRVVSQSGGEIKPQQNVQPEQKSVLPQAHTSAGTAEGTDFAADPATCSADKTAERGGYNSVYDSDVCSAYDVGANADENSVVS